MEKAVTGDEETEQAVNAAEDSAEEAFDTEEAFKARMMQLYDLYADWTGEAEDEDGEPSETQTDGSAVVEPSVALTTIAMFLVRVARDLEVADEQFDAIIGELRMQLGSSDDGDDDDGERHVA